MKNKTIRTRVLLPAQAARFLAGTVTARFSAFAGAVANPGDACPLVTIDADSFVDGHKQIPLAEVILTEVLPACLDKDLLIFGRVRIDPDSPEALVFAKDSGFDSFASLVDSFHGRLPFIGHVLRWAPYGLKSPQAGPTVSRQGQDAIPA